ncbi:unnamed protein product, partial [Prorocentrum cordatum]
GPSCGVWAPVGRPRGPMATERAPILLKVPKWISESWLAAAPGVEVASVDLQAGVLRLPAGSGKVSQPSTLALVQRDAPELFAYPKGDGDVAVHGPVVALTVTADARDGGYRGLVEQRAQDSFSKSSASRTVGSEKKILHLDTKPTVELKVGTAIPKTRQELYDLFMAEGPPASEIMAAVSDLLQAAGREGLTCEQLLERLPLGPSFVAVRRALVVLAEPREEAGQRRFVYGPLYRRPGWARAAPAQRAAPVSRFSDLAPAAPPPAPAPAPVPAKPSPAPARAPAAAPAASVAASAAAGPLLKRKR